MDTKMIAYRRGKLGLPLGYYLQANADLPTILHRADGSMVAAFAAGATPSKVVRAAGKDYRRTASAGLEI